MKWQNITELEQTADLYVSFYDAAEIDTRYAGRMKECQVKIKEQIAMVNTMIEFMQSMTDGIPDMALLTNESVNGSIRTEEKTYDSEEENDPNHGQDGYHYHNIDEWYINKLCENNRLSDTECRELKYLLTIFDHAAESEKGVIMESSKGRFSYFENTRNVYSSGYLWIQYNLFTLDYYLEQNSLEWSDSIKQIVLSEYYDTYVSENITTSLMTVGAESYMEGSGLNCTTVIPFVIPDIFPVML